MTTHVPNANITEPTTPLTPQLRSDLAYGRATGRSWQSLADEYGYDPGALRRATEVDPDFDAAQQYAELEVTRESEAIGLARLCALAASPDERIAMKAAELLVRHGWECRRNATRREVAAARSAHSCKKSDDDEGDRPGWITMRMPIQKQPSEAELCATRECINAEEATGRGPLAPRVPKVYLWGGKHITGQSIRPDESDRRVRVVKDSTVGVGMEDDIYWVVPADAVRWGPYCDDYRPEDQPPGDIWAAKQAQE